MVWGRDPSVSCGLRVGRVEGDRGLELELDWELA